MTPCPILTKPVTPVDVSFPTYMSLIYIGEIRDQERHSVVDLVWTPKSGWIARAHRLSFSSRRLRDPDDRAGHVYAVQHSTPDAFVTAIFRAAFRPKPRIVRALPATGYTDFKVDDWLYTEGGVDKWFLDEEFPDSDLPGFLEANWFEVIDTRRVIRERVSWADAVVEPRRHHEYKHLRFYVQLAYEEGGDI